MSSERLTAEPEQSAAEAVGDLAAAVPMGPASLGGQEPDPASARLGVAAAPEPAAGRAPTEAEPDITASGATVAGDGSGGTAATADGAVAGAGSAGNAVLATGHEVTLSGDAPAFSTIEAAQPLVATRPAARRLRLAGVATRARSFAVVATFVVGVAIGVVGYGLMNPSPPPSPWPALPGMPEPAEAHAVADALRSGDSNALAHLLNSDTLTALGSGLDPISDITDVQFLGSVGDASETFSAYLVRGKDAQGTSGIGGFVLHSLAGHVISVNQ